MNIFHPFSIDTRTLQKGDCFVALDGTKQKGITFLAQAFASGAEMAICSRRDEAEVPAHFISRIQFVDNPAHEMARLALLHRKQFSFPVVGVVGSVGKTSTKQFLSYLLEKRFKTLVTAGNLNNHLGLPMMISRIKPEHQMAVLEMGADHVGDLKKLVEMSEPDCAVLTPIAPEHLLGFGSLQGVYDGELEILLSPKLKILVTVDSDQELDRRLRAWNGKVTRVGFSEVADIRITDLHIENNQTHFKVQGRKIILPTPASFLAQNAALAIAMAIELGVDWSLIEGEWQPEMAKGRFAMRKLASGLTVIDDTYNSSPQAFSAALNSLEAMQFSRKWLVFSDMLELGQESEHWHRELAKEISQKNLCGVYAFGPQSQMTIETLKSNSCKISSFWFENTEKLVENLTPQLRAGDLILFKGSRGMKVEKVLETIEARYSYGGKTLG